MPIVRLPKIEKYFTASNALFRDARLSWEARGLMGYLLSRPDRWTLRVYDLRAQGPAGTRKLGRMLRELQAAGYLTRKRSARPDGTFEWTTTVYESPELNREA